jgi:small redox-active disulfide protein 2
MKIEVLGPGCPKCNALAENATAAVANMGADADVVKVTDINEITARGVMLTPALVVDGVVKASGRVPSSEEIQGMLS